ncbi:ABC transporter permease [Meiothermus sp. CFH 77666]|uniref:ABC transporter permease n=1 Tax=Meiothermus sp. CFH 77666 TaxID=2817942 RepID=UPI001AA06FEC|nr:ABC transporter permease [Meiothermus sp. CFH 77666]MBO1436321.1 ABC transporter permease [Meiothermus sp. CFH 77666]
MLRVLIWEFGKLVRLRSVQIGLLAALVLPILWAFAPGLRAQYGLELVSGWQVPALSLLTGMDFLFPFLTAMAAAEVLGSEVSMGTLKSVLLRPSPRSRLLGAKIIVVLVYPFILLLVSLVGSLLAGLPFGLGSFFGGTGLGEGSFAGVGQLTPSAALMELLRAHALAGVVLWPLSALAMLYAVVFLSTTSAALAAVSTLLLMRLLVAFPAIQPFLLTSYLDLYIRPEAVSWGVSLLIIYTIGFSILALLIFDRKDI